MGWFVIVLTTLLWWDSCWNHESTSLRSGCNSLEFHPTSRWIDPTIGRECLRWCSPRVSSPSYFLMIHPQSLLIHRGCTVLYEISTSPSPNVCWFTCFAIFCHSTWAVSGGLQLGTREPATRQFYQACQTLIGCQNATETIPKLPFLQHHWMRHHKLCVLPELGELLHRSKPQVLWSPRVLVQLVQLVPTGWWFQISPDGSFPPMIWHEGPTGEVLTIFPPSNGQPKQGKYVVISSP